MKKPTVLINASFFGCMSQTKSESMACVQRDPLAREVASHVSELWHTAKFRFREYWSVMADKVGSDYASRAYSNATLEDPFQAYLDVAACFHCEVVDLLHHRLGTTSVDGVKLSVSKNFFGDFGDLVLLSIGPVVGRENEFELVFFTVGYQP